MSGGKPARNDRSICGSSSIAFSDVTGIVEDGVELLAGATEVVVEKDEASGSLASAAELAAAGATTEAWEVLGEETGAVTAAIGAELEELSAALGAAFASVTAVATFCSEDSGSFSSAIGTAF
mmetsp:Transcript_27930/g.67871  ORF Transcript_27930/g.67871 Transcript_27930/m.67871 type:complete len:123 (-) Transcript_27930:7247-7615(-)